MGLYLQTPGVKQFKAKELVARIGAEYLGVRPPAFEDVPEDEILIAVVVNVMFDAALVCSNRIDYDRALNERRRHVTWLKAPRETVALILLEQGATRAELELYEVI